MHCRRFTITLTCLASTMFLAAFTAAGEITLIQHEGGVTVEVDGKPFTDYLTATGPKPILWPVIGPTGVALSRAFPMADVKGEKQDHPHQRSLWFTHGNVNGIDFWSELPGHGSIVHREYLTVAATSDEAVLATINDWLGPDGVKQCEDERRLTFRADGDSRSIDFDISIHATEGALTFGDTKEGSFGIRVPTVMDVDSGNGGRIVNSAGQTDKDAWGKPAAWVDYHGPVEGEVLGVAILNHPSSFRFPTTWHVRTYGLFAANPFGLRDFTGKNDVDGAHTVAKGDSLRLRYRLVLHRGDEIQAKLAEAFEEYSSQ